MSTHRRRWTRYLVPSALALSLGCGGSPPAVTAGAHAGGEPAIDPASGTPTTMAPAMAARQLGAETAITTAWGAIVPVPASWYVQESPAILRVQDPDRSLEVTFVAVKAASFDAAVTAAWQRVKPGFSLAVASTQLLPAREGWDEIGQRAYVTKAEASRVVIAAARRKGNTWHVSTIDSPSAAIGARGAQVNAMLTDMTVPGVERSSYAGKAAQLGAAQLAKLDAFAATMRELTGVPGAAIAVVHGGKVVFEAGYGVRALGARKPQPVTPATKFMIGSTTKSLTTLLMARLVEAGKLAWDQPITQVLPDFKLADPGVTSQVLVKHTVCACTGMPRQDLEFLFEFAGWDPERRLASMAEMKPTTGFGETFQYSNLMVAAGGWVAARAVSPTGKLGPAYDRAMQQRVLAPLGMTATTFDFRVAQRGDFAKPHGRGFGMAFEETPLAYEEAVVAVRPAGAAWSTVRDMAKYLQLELSLGKLPNGKQLISEANLLARRAPQVKINADNAYGLGLMLTQDHGIQIVHHGGNNLGYTADLFFLPAHDVGVVLLTNAGQANGYRNAVRQYFLEVMFDGKPEAEANLRAALALRETAMAEAKARISPADDAWLAPLLGAYDHPALGRVTLKRIGQAHVMDAGEWRSTLAKKTDQDGTVYVTTIDPPYVGMDMRPTTKDGKAMLVLDAGQQVYELVRAVK